MAELKARLRADLTTAMKARDTRTTGVLRMVLAAVGVEEVAGATARELSDDEVQRVLVREVRKRKEAATAFDGAGRAEQAAGELAEADVISGYLPSQLAEAELVVIVDRAVAAVTAQTGAAPGQRQMGLVMKAVNAEVAGRADGAVVAGLVKARLAG
jgi:hypothetical protein